MSGTFKPILPTATPKSSSHSTTFSSQQHNPLPITITSPSNNTFTTSPAFSNAVVSSFLGTNSSLDDSFSYGTVIFPNNSSYETNSHATNSQADHIKTVETVEESTQKFQHPYYEMRDKAMMKYDEDMSFYNSQVPSSPLHQSPLHQSPPPLYQSPPHQSPTSSPPLTLNQSPLHHHQLVDLEHDDLYNQALNVAKSINIDNNDDDLWYENDIPNQLLGKSAIDDDNDLFEELGLANTIDDDDKILCYGQGLCDIAQRENNQLAPLQSQNKHGRQKEKHKNGKKRQRHFDKWIKPYDVYANEIDSVIILGFHDYLNHTQNPSTSELLTEEQIVQTVTTNNDEPDSDEEPHQINDKEAQVSLNTFHSYFEQ
ncbi:16293_t:CDS:2 [Entrophospora sp. SA101]|nr:16293_t:CDS:2 [Entrophospora sp. SA101]